MSDEPYVWKKLKKFFGRDDDAVDATRIVTRLTAKGTPQELLRILSSGERDNVPHLQRRLDAWLGRKVTEADTAYLEALARKMKAGQAAADAIIGVRESLHRLEGHDVELEEKAKTQERERKLAAEQHEVKLAALRAQQREIDSKLSGTAVELEKKRAQLELKKIDAEMGALDKADQPAPGPAVRDPVEAFINGVEKELAKRLQKHENMETLVRWLRSRLAADIQLLRDSGREREAEGLQMYLDDKIDELESKGLP